MAPLVSLFYSFSLQQINQLPVCRRTTLKNMKSCHTVPSPDNLKLPIQFTCRLLNCGRKQTPKHPHRNQPCEPLTVRQFQIWKEKNKAVLKRIKWFRTQLPLYLHLPPPTSLPISCRRSPTLIWYPIKSPRMHISSIRHRSLLVIRLNLIFRSPPHLPLPLCFHPARVSPGTPRKSRRRRHRAENFISSGAIGSTRWNIIFLNYRDYYFLFQVCFYSSLNSKAARVFVQAPPSHTHSRAVKSCPIGFQLRLFRSS